MKTNLFTVIPSDHATAIAGCPLRWTNGDQRYVQIGQAANLVQGAEGVVNHDVLVFGAAIDHWHQDLRPNRMMTPYGPRYEWLRQAKETQSIMLNAHARKLGLQRWRDVLCWTQPRQVESPERIMMLRASNGARGTGQIYFDQEEVSPYTVSNILTESRNGEDFLRMLRLHTERFVFNTSADREPGESYQALTQASATEYIPNITKEFRVITDWQGKPWYYIERPRIEIGRIHETVIHTASAADRGMHNELSPGAFAAAVGSVDIMDELKTMFEHIEVPLQSFDVFITSDRQWGILETSPEFCHRDVPNQQLNQHTRKLVEHQFHLIEQGIFP